MEQAAVLRECLAQLAKFFGKVFVVKIGGEALISPCFKQMIEDLSLLAATGIKIVLVFGSGQQIDERMRVQELKITKINGRRITSPEAMKIVSEVADEEYYKIESIVKATQLGVTTIRSFCSAEPLGEENELTGEPIKVLGGDILGRGCLYVFSPVCIHLSSVGEKDRFLNANADDVAMTVAKSLGAEKLIFLTNVEGVISDNKLVSSITTVESEKLIERGIISGGMIPKIRAAASAFSFGVKSCHIISYKNGSILSEILTTVGSGTMIIA